MITVRGRLLGALLLAALLSAFLSVPAVASQDETSSGFETVLRGTNDYRKLNGVDRLVHDPRMSAVAQAWAERMAADYASSGDLNAAFRHNPNMSTQVPSGWESVGENIAMNGGYSQPYDRLLAQWRLSPGHNANMLNSRWTHIGIGTYQDDTGRTWGVQVFGDYGDPALIPNPVDAAVDLDNLTFSGTAGCVVLVRQPANTEFFRQCGPRPGNAYVFSDVPASSYSFRVLAPGGTVLYPVTVFVSPPAPPDPASISTVYRFWSPNNKAHFYTNSVAERDLILRTYPSTVWTYEGGTYNAFSSQQPGTVPLYRFWSAKFKGHFFTTSETEKNQVIANYDDATWLFEGIAYYVYPVDPAYVGTVTVARFWSQDNKHHFYTASAAERDQVIATYPDHEWAPEGDAFRVPSSAIVAAPLP